MGEDELKQFNVYLPAGLVNRPRPRWTALVHPGSTVVMTFQLPLELLDEADRPGRRLTVEGARKSGTPFISFYAPGQILQIARDAGFRDARHVPGSQR